MEGDPRAGPTPPPHSARRTGRRTDSTVVLVMPRTSWKLFQTKITIGTIEIVSSTTAIAEP